MKSKVKFEEVYTSDLYKNCIYEGGKKGNLSDEVISKLMNCENSGGFRKVGKSKGKLNYVVLYSAENNKEEWVDEINYENKLVKYNGDNKKVNVDIHDTRKKGNLILKKTFDSLKNGNKKEIAPFFMFTQEEGRDVKFIGLLVPGHKDVEENLIEVDIEKENGIVKNYVAYFTILDTKIIDRRWLDDLKKGISYESQYAPKEWKDWVDNIDSIDINHKEPIMKDEEVNYTEIDSEKEFLEGNTKERLIKVKERNSQIRRAKLDAFKTEFGQAFCEVCGENDEVVLDVHHEKIKVSDMDYEHKTKLSDLRVLCANCHRKVHGHNVSVEHLISIN
ncbi:hypothetical protein GNF80_04895 [Clostridium perfringens]|nr:hypothetical protein [Clostridium perfringens]